MSACRVVQRLVLVVGVAGPRSPSSTRAKKKKKIHVQIGATLVALPCITGRTQTFTCSSNWFGMGAPVVFPAP